MTTTIDVGLPSLSSINPTNTSTKESSSPIRISITFATDKAIPHLRITKEINQRER